MRALGEVCGFREVSTDWAGYRHTTDAGIIQEIYEVHAGRGPLAEEVAAFRGTFLGLLAQAADETPFSAVPGAPGLLQRLTETDGIGVALATGAWGDSARLKMASAGMCYDDFPAASSDDAPDRETIVRVAIRRAGERYGAYDSVVYVGDGLWDARTCRNLGIPLVGVGREERAVRLLAEGAVRVLADFSEPDLFFDCLEEMKRLR